MVAFDGSAQVIAKLSRGGSTDFNAMTRSERCYHTFGRRRLSGDSTFVARADVTVLFLAEGDALELRNEGERIGLVRYDAVVLEGGSVWKLEGQGMVYIVDVWYHGDEEDEDESYYE